MVLKEGWVCLANANKYHYIRDARSLCGKWGYFGNAFDADTFESSDDCKSCRAKLNKEKETKGD